MEGGAVRPTLGSRVIALRSDRIGEITIDDGSDLPFKVKFDDGRLPETDWFKESDVAVVPEKVGKEQSEVEQEIGEDTAVLGKLPPTPQHPDAAEATSCADESQATQFSDARIQEAPRTTQVPLVDDARLDVPVANGFADSQQGAWRSGDMDADIGAVMDLKALEEEEFSQDIHHKLPCQQSQYGIAGGAVLGTVAGLVAAPLAVAGLVAGGALGVQWARRKLRQDLAWGQPATLASADALDPDGAASQRPTFRRVSHLVRWARRQLYDMEAEPIERRALVLDETIRAFSPWVQQLYLIRARGVPTEEAWEVLDNLTPLYCLLQQMVVAEVVMQVATLVSRAIDRNALDSACVERCRVGFPTILEVISTVDRLDYAIHERIARSLSRYRDPFPLLPRVECRPRFERLVAALRGVLERPGLEEAIARHVALASTPAGRKKLEYDERFAEDVNHTREGRPVAELSGAGMNALGAYPRGTDRHSSASTAAPMRHMVDSIAAESSVNEPFSRGHAGADRLEGHAREAAVRPLHAHEHSMDGPKTAAHIHLATIDGAAAGRLTSGFGAAHANKGAPMAVVNVPRAIADSGGSSAERLARETRAAHAAPVAPAAVVHSHLTLAGGPSAEALPSEANAAGADMAGLMAATNIRFVAGDKLSTETCASEAPPGLGSSTAEVVAEFGVAGGAPNGPDGISCGAPGASARREGGIMSMCEDPRPVNMGVTVTGAVFADAFGGGKVPQATDQAFATCIGKDYLSGLPAAVLGNGAARSSVELPAPSMVDEHRTTAVCFPTGASSDRCAIAPDTQRAAAEHGTSVGPVFTGAPLEEAQVVDASASDAGLQLGLPRATSCDGASSYSAVEASPVAVHKPESHRRKACSTPSGSLQARARGRSVSGDGSVTEDSDYFSCSDDEAS